MRIDLIEKLVFALSIMTVVAVGAGVTMVSLLFPGGLRSGISSTAEDSDQATLDWLQDLRARKGRGPAFQAYEEPELRVGALGKDGKKITQAQVTQSKKESIKKYWGGGDTLPKTERVPTIPWLRRVPGVKYKPARLVSRLTYQKYQSFQDTWTEVQNGGGQFVETEFGTAYEVTWMKKSSRLAKTIGLQPGDQVISINGLPVGKSVGAGREMYEQLKGQSKFAVLVLRKGRRLVLSFNVAR